MSVLIVPLAICVCTFCLWIYLEGIAKIQDSILLRKYYIMNNKLKTINENKKLKSFLIDLFIFLFEICIDKDLSNKQAENLDHLIQRVAFPSSDEYLSINFFKRKMFNGKITGINENFDFEKYKKLSKLNSLMNTVVKKYGNK